MQINWLKQIFVNETENVGLPMKNTPTTAPKAFAIFISAALRIRLSLPNTSTITVAWIANVPSVINVQYTYLSKYIV